MCESEENIRKCCGDGGTEKAETSYRRNGEGNAEEGTQKGAQGDAIGLGTLQIHTCDNGVKKRKQARNN